MSAHRNALNIAIASSVAAAALTLSLGAATAQSKLTSQDIVKALQPKKLTRSLSLAPVDQAKADETKRFVDGLRGKRTRSLSVDEREQIATIAEDKPKIDIQIKFEYNSANIARSALPDVDALGKALSDDTLKGRTFVLAGHTDAVGGDQYNQELSDRRADSVKNYLVEKYGLSSNNLVTAGYGKTRLKNTQDPAAAENRRVEVVNMAD